MSEVKRKIADDEALRVIKETIERVLNRYGIEPVKIVLFGSRARGDFRSDSDWDILVVVNENLDRKSRISISAEILKELAQYLIPCDLIIRDLSEVDELQKRVHSITKIALREGMLL